MRKTLLSIMLCVLAGLTCQAQDNVRWSVAFWNVENFFDTQHDTLKDDIAFTPQGENHWNAKRYADKRNKIYKMVAAMQWPAVVGLAEVENDRVLRDLCRYTPLRRYGYEFVHYESPDKRGIDCALLYRRGVFKVFESRRIDVSDSTEDFYTRDILFVGGVLGEKDSCYIFVNHWPSKRNGAVAERHRIEIARLLLGLMDSLQQEHPTALVLAMGDFNAAPDEDAISKGLGFEGGCRNAAGLYNLMCKMAVGEGSYKYKDTWSRIDQMIANRELKAEVFAPDFMLRDDTRYMGMKPFRTYSGMRYLGGYSDHLPIIVNIP
ncbi:MAG: endonuclease/exonuclease/phosphatase family protein [Bacteroidales bacterium]|nr:endonuclease/exonuclease/phosphatase family protein [Bacteroidales bacterium]